MNESTLFFVLSVAIAIVIFAIQSIQFWKSKKITDLTFVENKCIALFSPLNEGIDELEIKYQEHPIKENLYLYQATIYNSGVSDIPDTLIYKPLCLKLPEKFKWKSFKLFDKSEGLSITHNIDGDSLKIEWTLFKKLEYFRFDAVVEFLSEEPEIENKETSKSSDKNLVESLSEKISFGDSRIHNLNISKRNFRSYESTLRWTKTFIWYLLSIGFIYMIMNDKSNHIVYTIHQGNDLTSKSVELKVNGKKQIFLIDSLNSKILYDSVKTNLTISNIKIVEKKNEDKALSTIMMILPMIGLLILLEQRRIRNKREKLNLISPGDWDIYKDEEC